MNRLDEKVYCSMCKQKTNHQIIYTHSEKSEQYDDIIWHTQYHIVQCLGCDNVSFVKQYGDEDSWDYIDGERVWIDELIVYPEEPEETVRDYLRKQREIFPREFKNVPPTINNLYLQIIDVHNQGYLLLSTVGIRTLIEAICLDVGITEGYLYDENSNIRINKKEEPIISPSLEGKIYGLFERNMIIWDQAIILQKIRDIGNAAAHEIKEPTEPVFVSAVQIIEQVLNNVYELKVHKLLKK